MYNKIFTKILDSSVWLESDAARIVWMTFLAAMDEDGFAQFASVPNLAHRARVSLQEAEAAVSKFESPDPYSSDPANEGRRIERVPGGWMVLNSAKYREIVTRAVAQEKTRLRVRKFRDQKAKDVTLGNAPVTPSNAIPENVTPVKRSETPSEAVSVSEAYTEAEKNTSSPDGLVLPLGEPSKDALGKAAELKNQADEIYSLYPRKVGKHEALKKIAIAIKDHGFDLVKTAATGYAATWKGETDMTFCPHPATWFNKKRFLDAPETWERGEKLNGGAIPAQRKPFQTPAEYRNSMMIQHAEPPKFNKCEDSPPED